MSKSGIQPSLRLRKDFPVGVVFKLRYEGQNIWTGLLKIKERGFCSRNRFGKDWCLQGAERTPRWQQCSVGGNRDEHDAAGGWGSSRGQPMGASWPVKRLGISSWGQRMSLKCLKQESDMIAFVFSKNMTLTVVRRMGNGTATIL